MSPDPRHEAALEYVRRGLAVVPLHSPVQIGGGWRCTCGDSPCKHKVGKHPRPGYGLKHSIQTIEEVEDAWAKWPDANVGVVIPGGFFVADLDGSEAIAWWDQNGAAGTPTRTALSGSGVGQHRWYRLPAGHPGVRNGTIAKFGDKIHQEVKIITAGMGYVVAPPSVWAKEGWSERGGALYAWWEGGGGAVEAPGALLASLAVSGPSGATTESGGDLLAQAVGMVEGQGRDTLMLRYLGVMRRAGAGKIVLQAAAEEMNSAFAEQLEQRMVDQHVNTILGKPGGQDLSKMTLSARMDQNGSGSNGSTPNGDANWPEGAPYRLQVERTDPKTWLLHFPDGVVRVGSASLSVWGRIQTAHLEQLERSPRWNPGSGANNGWLGVSGLHARLEELMTDEDHIDPAPELTVSGQVRAIVRQYVGVEPDHPAGPSILEQGGVWWDREGGRVCFKFQGLCTSYARRVQASSALSPKEIAHGIKIMGGEPSISSTKGFSKQTRFGWVPIFSLLENEE